eukprot:CAMPEP_0182525968 /NCGR_PEP_ID=MMETSP1323-20130603/2848_1 /TAXON_ID=236787 /ORGANISM="Florenciella parvula, Strain RCC1693" /LENGTH=69 /DNA_ID=CAMNT_0024734745 /DNA_START=457 /DNA_END=666 /DNA_ORIENTATION=-
MPDQFSLFLFLTVLPANAARCSSARRTSPSGFGGFAMNWCIFSLATRSSSACSTPRSDFSSASSASFAL